MRKLRVGLACLPVLVCLAVTRASAGGDSSTQPRAPGDRGEGGSGPNGRIAGTIETAVKLARVSAVDRNVKVPMIAKEVPVREHAGRILDGGARYEVDVPPGTYDLHFETADGVRIEGADLRVKSRPDDAPLRERDREAIRKRVSTMRTFANEKSVLAIEGRGERAKVLVKLVRTGATSYDGDFGEPVAVFRWEIWNFRKRTGSWVRERKYIVLRRFLIAKRKMHEVKWEFRPELGGVEVGAGATVTRDVDLARGEKNDREKSGGEKGDDEKGDDRKSDQKKPPPKGEGKKATPGPEGSEGAKAR